MDELPSAGQAPEQGAKPEKPCIELTERLLGQIEEALCQVGDYGEVRLVIVKGRIRFIQVMRSMGARDTD